MLCFDTFAACCTVMVFVLLKNDLLMPWHMYLLNALNGLMNTVQQGYEYKEFPMAEGVVQRSYCTESGLLASGACPSTAVGYYKADDLPAVCNYNHSGGIISSQEPDTTGIDTD